MACTTSYKSSIETLALNCLVFEKIAFFAFWRQTDRQTDEQMDNTDALSRSRCRERRLNNVQLRVVARNNNKNNNDDDDDIYKQRSLK